LVDLPKRMCAYIHVKLREPLWGENEFEAC